MLTATECECCSEIDVIAQKLDKSEANINCIPKQEGFEPVFLNVWVLQAYFLSQTACDINCIPEHEGFEPLFLNVWVLQAYFLSQTAWWNVWYSAWARAWVTILYNIVLSLLIGMTISFSNWWYRFITYQQLTSWCWGLLGRRVHFVLPSCVMNKIRTKLLSGWGRMYMVHYVLPLYLSLFNNIQVWQFHFGSV